MSPPASILLVEDDDQVRAFVRALLASDGYRVLEARTGHEGLRAGESAGDALDLLISDMLLPELSGYDIAVSLRKKNPGLKVILMTGYVEGEIVQRCVSELNATFIDKPFQPGVLRKIVRDTLNLPARAVRADPGILDQPS